MISRLAVVAAAGALALSGCSSDSEAPQEDSTPATSTTQAPSGHGAYAQCLHEHGVSAPPGPVVSAPPGVDPGTWDKASKACATLAPGPGPG